MVRVPPDINVVVRITSDEDTVPILGLHRKSAGLA